MKKRTLCKLALALIPIFSKSLLELRFKKSRSLSLKTTATVGSEKQPKKMKEATYGDKYPNVLLVSFGQVVVQAV